MTPRKKVTIRTLTALKEAGMPAAAITAYDYPSAVYADRAEMDWVLVGDSGGMCALGHANTMPVTMDEMLHFTRAVCRGAKTAFVVGDMPFGSYQISDEEAVRNAVAFMRCGCDAVKLEGGERVCSRIRAIVDAGIPVMGHLGLTPQAMSQQGGYRVVCKTARETTALQGQAQNVIESGAFAILLEAMPEESAATIHHALNHNYTCQTPPALIYGIGAGGKLDGQLLIYHDVMGMFVSDEMKSPKFAKRYAECGRDMQAALEQYRREVKAHLFPFHDNLYPLSESQLAEIKHAPVAG